MVLTNEQCSLGIVNKIVDLGQGVVTSCSLLSPSPFSIVGPFGSSHLLSPVYICWPDFIGTQNDHSPLYDCFDRVYFARVIKTTSWTWKLWNSLNTLGVLLKRPFD